MLERIDRANTKVLSISMFASKANFNTTGESLEEISFNTSVNM